MIDTHAHLDDAAFSGDLPGVLERAQAAGVDHILAVGTDLPSSRAAVTLAEGHESIWAAVGVHPHDAGKLYPADLDELRELKHELYHLHAQYQLKQFLLPSNFFLNRGGVLLAARLPI